MDIDHLHFYVEDAQQFRNWLVHHLGFTSLASQIDRCRDTQVELVGQGAVRFLLSSARSPASPVAHYLMHHPPGVVDIALRMSGLVQWWKQFLAQRSPSPLAESSADLQTSELQQDRGLVWGTITLTDTLRHTLVERPQASASDLTFPDITLQSSAPIDSPSWRLKPPLNRIDHIVVNVPKGLMAKLSDWYARFFGFQQKQSFRIKTPHSGLESVVMQDPTGTIQIPINEPTTPNSQIQEFLDHNSGGGVQHIALHTKDAIATVAQLRQRQVPFITVPSTYYEALMQRDGCRLAAADVEAIARQQLLVDWQPTDPQALLLQTFTQPVFAEPTLFFEIIERQPTTQLRNRISMTDEPPQRPRLSTVQGFGEQNFQALFEAIEQEQIRRGNFQPFC
ncbi:MAG: 4-hydroxyphenylpyruvate dioxygenase [Cyanobacteria bacterium J06638_20]